MSNTRKKLDGGVRINPNTDALVNDGDINIDSSDNKLKVRLGGADKTVATEDLLASINTIPKVAYCRMDALDSDVFIGANTTVTLSTTDGDTEIVSLSSNEFTLEAGKYEIDWSFGMWTNGTGESVGSCQLYNVTDAIVQQNGTPAAGDGNNYGTLAPSTGSCIVEITVAKTYKIRGNNIQNSGSHTLYVGWGSTNANVDKGYVKIKKIG